MLDRLTQSDSNQTTKPDNSYFSAPPTISLPKGGEMIKGKGENFAVIQDFP